MTRSAVLARKLLPLYVCAALAMIFYAPTQFANRYEISDSYIFGYNNRVGILLLVIFAFCTGLLAWAARCRFSVVGVSDRVGRGVFWGSMLVAALLCVAMYVLTARSGSYGESVYLLDRLGLAAQGQRPYRDFEFAYGAAFLYGPLLLSKLLGLTVVNAYYLFWLMNVLAGVWLLRVIVDGIDYPGRHRSAIFLLLFPLLLMGEVTTGINYAGLRFFAGPALALWVYRLIRRPQGEIAGAAAVCASTIALLLLSPELGVGFAVGIYAFLIAYYARTRSWSWVTPYGVALAVLCAVFWQAGRMQVFYTMRTFSHGGINFPIVPALHILMLFFAVFLCSSYLVFVWREGRYTNTSCMLAVAFTFLPSALGHCDPGHIIFNGTVFLIVASLWAASTPVRWRLWCSVFIVVAVICSATFLLGYAGQLFRSTLALMVRDGGRRGAQLEDTYYRKMLGRYGRGVADTKRAELELMSRKDATKSQPWRVPYAEGIVEAPFGYAESQNRAYIDEGYFDGTVNAFDPEQIEEKIEELKRHGDRELVLSAEQGCYFDFEAQKTFISVLFFYPFRWKVRHTENAYTPLCEYVRSHYTIRVPASPDTYGYAIWSPKR
ncbi:hypothetical protein [Edaphobacter flagellatus]|uniref:hypothetical protein n=1 Tax=Edaphobacter flagellatus TaxID=1933044 RepID=UPI0021B39954|nr:hypothetical protein [Edaphobacter flagellatus]